MTKRKSAYGAEPANDAQADKSQCAGYGCFLPATVAAAGKTYCVFHDRQRIQDFDAISEHLRKRRKWFDYVALTKAIHVNEFYEFVKSGQRLNLPESLQPDGRNFLEWQRYVKSTVTSRIKNEIEAIVDSRVNSRSVDRSKSEAMSWAAKVMAGKGAHPEIPADDGQK